MIEQDQFDLEVEVTRIIQDYLKSSSFTQRQLTDTPIDDLQIVNKKYVDSVRTAAGNTSNVQFNDSGSLGGDDSFTWDKTNNVLLITNGQYYSSEKNNNTVSGTATINWNTGNVQYVTMTGNTTFTFTNPKSGGRYFLHMAGAFTPTFPGSIRWPSSVTPTATATTGKKDIYTFVYSGIEGLYTGIQSANFSIT